MRRWNFVPSRGIYVDHPAVVAEAALGDSARHPRLRERDGLQIVSYCRTRVYLDRDAWDMLLPDGVLVMRVQPADGGAFVLALSSDELERTFGKVKQTRSWDQVRCYHFAQVPPAAHAFRVRAGR